jgi:hypothetical protein
MPRGYGGVAIIWRKDIDHIIRPLEDGSEKDTMCRDIW